MGSLKPAPQLYRLISHIILYPVMQYWRSRHQVVQRFLLYPWMTSDLPAIPAEPGGTPSPLCLTWVRSLGPRPAWHPQNCQSDLGTLGKKKNYPKNGECMTLLIKAL